MENIPYDKRTGKIWYNSEMVNWTDAKVHLLNHGLHYASCVFEGERVYNGEIFKLEEHTQRLFHSAKRMGIKIPYSEKEINDACKEIILIQKVNDGYVRPIVWRGSEMMAISAQKNKIHVAVAAWEWGSYFDPKLKLNGIKLNISSWRRPHPNSVPWDTKAAGLYMICTLSKHEAESKGFTDSLMLDHEGNIAEATGANIFFKMPDGNLHTPTPDCFLDGITRKTVIEIAESNSIKNTEKDLSVDDLMSADEIFFTGTATEVVGVVSIDKNNIGDGNVGETTKKITEKYQQIVNGEDDNFKSYITLV